MFNIKIFTLCNYQEKILYMTGRIKHDIQAYEQKQLGLPGNYMSYGINRKEFMKDVLT